MRASCFFSVVRRKVYQSARSQSLPIRLAPRCWRRPSSAAFSIAASMASSVAVASLMSARKASQPSQATFAQGMAGATVAAGAVTRGAWKAGALVAALAL